MRRWCTVSRGWSFLVLVVVPEVTVVLMLRCIAVAEVTMVLVLGRIAVVWRRCLHRRAIMVVTLPVLRRVAECRWLGRGLGIVVMLPQCRCMVRRRWCLSIGSRGQQEGAVRRGCTISVGSRSRSCICNRRGGRGTAVGQERRCKSEEKSHALHVGAGGHLVLRTLRC